MSLRILRTSEAHWSPRERLFARTVHQMPVRRVTLRWIAAELFKLAALAFSLGAFVKLAEILVLGASQ